VLKKRGSAMKKHDLERLVILLKVLIIGLSAMVKALEKEVTK
jgi:hypothetical protein